MMNEIKIYKSSWKSIRLSLLAFPFVAIGVFMLVDESSPHNQFMAWLCILFFGIGPVISIYNIIDRKPYIILNELGIHIKTLHKKVINWNIIQDAYLNSVNRQPFICLVLKDSFDAQNIFEKPISRKMSQINKAMGFQELNLYLGPVKVDEEKLLNFIVEMAHLHPQERKEKLLDSTEVLKPPPPNS
ncbi:MAG: STM3941 family protein [Bacteroidota bacterium]